MTEDHIGRAVPGCAEDPMRVPLICAGDLAALDDCDVVQGYLDGRDGDAEPGGNRSLSYWHGWRNGRVDGGHQPKDAAQAQLAHSFLSTLPDPPEVTG